MCNNQGCWRDSQCRDRDKTETIQDITRDETETRRSLYEARPRRDRDVYINGRDETETRRLFYCLKHYMGPYEMHVQQCHITPPPLMSFPTPCQCEFKRAACAGHFIVHTCIVLLLHLYAGLLWCLRIFSIFCKIFRAYMH